MIRERNLYLEAVLLAAMGSILTFAISAVSAAPLAQSESTISINSNYSNTSKTILLAQADDDLLLDESDA